MRSLRGIAAAVLAAVTTFAVAPAYAAAPPTAFADLSGLTPLALRSIAAVTRLGLMNGTGPTTFDPFGQETRADAVAGVVRIFGLTSPSGALPAYTDVAPTSPDFGPVQAAEAAGLMAGWAPTAGAFDPNAPITRAQLAVLATNALQMQSQAASLASDVRAFAYLIDVGFAGYDLGNVNAMLENGVIPPYSDSLYRPQSAVNREEVAVTFWRLFLMIDSPVTTVVQPAQPTVHTGFADLVTATLWNRIHTQVPSAWDSLYHVAFASTTSAVLAGSTASDWATTLTALSAGTYPVTASATGGLLTNPVTGQASILAFWPVAASSGSLTCQLELPSPGNPSGQIVCTLTLYSPGPAVPASSLFVQAVAPSPVTSSPFPVTSASGNSYTFAFGLPPVGGTYFFQAGTASGPKYTTSLTLSGGGGPPPT